MQEIYDNEENRIEEDEYEIFKIKYKNETVQKIEKIVLKYKKIISFLSFICVFFLIFIIVIYSVQNSNNKKEDLILKNYRQNFDISHINQTNKNINILFENKSKNKPYNEVKDNNDTNIDEKNNNLGNKINNNSNALEEIKNNKSLIQINNNISVFLNKNNNLKEIRNNKIDDKKKIHVKYIDFLPLFQINKFDIHNILLERYDVIISDQPDYLIFGQFGKENRYYNCVKLFFSLENDGPNFNQTDYAIGIHYIENGDRYFRKPIRIGQLSTIYSIYNFTQKKGIKNINKKFCASFVSNPLRRVINKFYKKLSEYKTIDFGGSYLNNDGRKVQDKIEFLQKYKFSIFFKNSKNLGNITEQLFDAFKAGTIPIYYGDDSFLEYLNNKSYIHIKNEGELDEKIELIKKIDQNNTLYEEMIREKIVIDDSKYQDEYRKYKDFIYHIFEQDKEKAKRYERINKQ